MFVAGAYEFISDDGVDTPDAKAWASLSKAFAMLDYSVGALTPVEAAAFKANAVDVPKHWLALDSKEVVTTVVDTSGGQVGFVFFPMLKTVMATPSENIIAKIDKETAKLRGQVKVVVGVSSWGVQNEADYLEKAKSLPDMLLGSGPGVGFAAKATASGKVLWMHTFSKGKALYSVDMLAWPQGQGFKWEMGTNYTTQALVLDDSYPPNAAVEALFAGVPDPNDLHK